MRRTTRIPVYRQPPVWLVACVVVAALLPVLLRAFGIEPGPPLDVARIAEARANEPDTVALRPSSPPLSPSPRAAAVAESTPIGPALDELDASSEDDDEIVIIDEPAPRRAAEDLESDGDPAIARDVDRTALSEARAACRRGNKDAARAVYRDLPIGDERRKKIRKACRQEGVWLL